MLHHWQGKNQSSEWTIVRGKKQTVNNLTWAMDTVTTIQNRRLSDELWLDTPPPPKGNIDEQY